jgi:macrolide transport system ATP-binding/permease protein
MDLIRTLLSRCAALFSRQKLDADLDEELRGHIDLAIEENLKRGMSREQARTSALRDFGGITQTKEAYRTQQGLPFLETVAQDVRYALRRLGKSPGFTIIALLTLALGIGANTGIFTLLNAVLLKSLPVPNPDQLFLVKQNDSRADESLFSYPLFQRLRQQSPDSAAIAAMSWAGSYYVATGGGTQERALGQLVSGNYFEVFETYPVLGRLLTSEDDSKLSGSPVAVISYQYWQQHFGGDLNVIGRAVDVNRVPFTIVGVSARVFFGARQGSEPDFWMPLTMQSDVRYHGLYSSRGSDPTKPWVPQDRIEWLQLVIRARDSAVVPHLLASMNQQYRQYLELLPQNQNDVQRQQAISRDHLTLEPGQRGFATLKQEFQQPLFLLMGMAAMVLLIACANITNLLLARSAARRRAHALQLSLGASRIRLIRQMLTECLLLSIGGGILGIAVAFWCIRVLPKWASTGATTIPLNLTPDTRVLFFSLFIAMATGILFGLAPAFQSAHVDPASVMKASAANISGHEGSSRWSLRKTLVASQVALSLVLLVGAGMFLRTLSNYSRLDPGFDRNHILSVHLNTSLVGYKTNEYLPLYQKLIDRMDEIPGVRSSAVDTCALSDGCPDATDATIQEEGGKGQPVHVQFNRVSLDYFKTVGLELVRGRAFATTDNATGPGVALVNQAFASRFLNGSDPVGKWLVSNLDNGSGRFEIVGVVTDARVNDIREGAPPLAYFPLAQHAGNIDSIDVRTAADPQWVEAQVRQAVAQVDYRLPIVEVIPLSEQVARNLTQERLITRVTTMFGLLALGLACLGLYGVMSYTVQRRTSEIGVRLALGSTHAAILWLILKETLVVISGGAVFGLVLSILGTHLARGFLFGLSPEDPATIATAASLLFLVSMAAGFLAARKAASIDPIQALRTE